MQGLLVYNVQGELIYSRNLDNSVVETCIDFASEHGMLSGLTMGSISD